MTTPKNRLDDDAILKAFGDKIMDNDEKAIFAIAEKLDKDGEKGAVAALLYAVLIAYHIDAVASMMLDAVHPILQALKIVVDEDIQNRSTKN